MWQKAPVGFTPITYFFNILRYLCKERNKSGPVLELDTNDVLSIYLLLKPQSFSPLKKRIFFFKHIYNLFSHLFANSGHKQTS